MSVSRKQFEEAVHYLMRRNTQRILPSPAPDGKIWTVFNAVTPDGREVNVSIVNPPGKTTEIEFMTISAVKGTGRGSLSLIASLKGEEGAEVRLSPKEEFGFASEADVEDLILSMAKPPSGIGHALRSFAERFVPIL